MNPRERAAALRFRAAYLKMLAARDELGASCIDATVATQRFGAAWQGSIDDELAEHPDMAELNIRLDALYEPPHGQG